MTSAISFASCRMDDALAEADVQVLSRDLHVTSLPRSHPERWLVTAAGCGASWLCLSTPALLGDDQMADAGIVAVVLAWTHRA